MTMTIAVLGGSGMIGAPVCDLLAGRGHEVRRLSRSTGVDLATGTGLAAALAGADVVINAANGPASGKAAATLVDGTGRLLEASEAHHVCVSIVGIDELAAGSAYYRVKLAQEQAVRDSGRPFTIVRATQFHPFLARPLRTIAKARLAPRSRARFQPVDVEEAAAAIADAAEREPQGGTVTVAGPEVLTLSELAVRPGVPLPLPLPPGLGRLLRAGAATIADPDVRGTVTYREWLARG